MTARLCIWVVLGFCAVAALVPSASALEGYRPNDGLWPEDRELAVQWGATWAATYKANLERWTKEVERATPDANARAARLHLRMVRLLEALLGKFPADAETRIDAYREIAERYAQAGLVGRGNYCLKRLMDEFPGRLEVAASALRRMRAAMENPGHVEEGLDWTEYLAERLAALHRVGYLLDSDPNILEAQKDLVAVLRHRGRLLEAAELLRSLERASGRDAWSCHELGALLAEAGRGQEALRVFQELDERFEDNRAKERIAHLSQEVLDAPPTFPGQFALEIRWEGLRGRAFAEIAERVGDLIRDDAEGKSLIREGEGWHTSIWASVDRVLLAREPAALAAIRQEKEAEARAAAAAVARRPAGGTPGLLSVYRRFPWAASAHRGLMLSGEEALRRGQAGLALRCFRDAVAHAADGALRAEAQAGLWLALAQTPRTPEDIEQAFKGVSPDAAYPWLGRREPAKAIRERLAAAARPAAAEAPPPSLAALERRVARIPPLSPWPAEILDKDVPRDILAAMSGARPGLQLDGRDVLISGPDLLACFGEDLASPRWVRTPRHSVGHQGRFEREDRPHIVVPGPFLPAVANGRVLTRWGLDPTRRHATDVAAFDLATGQMAWSTGRDPAWDDLWPTSDPTVADGRVYLLAVAKGYSSLLPVSPAYLVCLEERTGATHWKRHLASQYVALTAYPGQYQRECQVDLAHWGNAVTVRDGEVYCSSNLGFVARCDARDGLVEWARAYPRARLAHNVLRVVRRQGSPPIVTGDRVLFLPRDQQGVFAVERATGKLLWDNPFAPSEELLGLRDGLVLVGDGDEVAALDTATGRPRWARRFPRGIRGRPALVGSDLLVGTPDKLHRLAARTGSSVEEADWPKDGPMTGFLLRGNTLVGLADWGIGQTEEPTGKALNPRAPAARTPLGLPLVQSWELRRPDPELVVPPPEAKLAGKVLLFSRGVLECLRATAQGGIEWQRLLPPGGQLACAEGLLLVIYPTRVVALDAAAGTLRWETELPFRVHQPWRVAPPFLVFGSFGVDVGAQQACVLELATGRRLWHRELRELRFVYGDTLRHIAWDGKSLHFLGQVQAKENEEADVVCDPAKGSIEAIRPFLPKGQKWPMLLASDLGFGFGADPAAGAYEFSLDGRTPPARQKADVRQLDSPATQKRLLRISGKWAQVYQYEYSPQYRHTAWILQRGNPSYDLKRARPGVIQGDTFVERGGPRLSLVDLPSRKEVAYTVAPRLGTVACAIGGCGEGDTLLVVAGIEEGNYEPYRTPLCLQVDAFERATGRRRGSQVLSEIPYWKYVTHYYWRDHPTQETQAISGDGVLLLSEMDGVHALTSVPPGEAPGERPVRIAYRSPRPVVVDGSLEEWDGASATPLQGAGGDGLRGKLLLAHDATDLYLGIVYPNADPRPRRGCGDYGGGDWVEVGLQTNTGSFRWGFGADDRGRLIWERAGPAKLPAGLRGEARHDFLRQRLAYEVAIPLKTLLRQDEGNAWRRLGLSVTVWKEHPRDGSVPILAAGRALAGRALPSEQHDTVYLHPQTREGEEALLALAHGLPELPEAQEAFEEACRIRALSSAHRAVTELYRDYLKRHPRGQPALQALIGLDQKLRTDLDVDPTPAILKLAEEAGVHEAARQRYARLSKVSLSQWVHIDPKKPGRMILIGLDAGKEDESSNRRVFWGEDLFYPWGTLHTPTRQHAGPLPETGSWQELRVPLLWLDLHESPIHGIAFIQHGGGGVTWDRTAVAAEGKERVFLEDAPPEGRTEGSWSWVSQPVKSGSRAHANGAPGTWDSRAHHLVHQLKTPIVDHILPPSEGAFLSQWVYLDPAKPTRAVALNLRDKWDWRFRAVWGEAMRYYRYMGPLPKAGEWVELRLPLAWTPFACRPINGLGFEQHGGRVFWDRTALATQGRETVLVEDETPKGTACGLAWEWVDKPVRSGKKAHTQAPRGDFNGHGVYDLKPPILQHMPYEPERVVAALKATIPKLGPTDMAWRLFELLLLYDFSDAKGWLEAHSWFFKAIPDHPRGDTVLTRIFESYRDLQEKDPAGKVEKLIEECPPPIETRYAYRRRTFPGRDSFVRTWRVIGPFPNPGGKGHETAYPPETEPTRLTAEYDGVGGRGGSGPLALEKVRWKACQSEADAIDLSKLFQPNLNVVAYAVCWVYSDKPRAGTIEMGSDDGCKVWLNRKLILDRVVTRTVSPRDEIVPIFLSQGWTEILVKIDQGINAWGFCLEFVSPEGSGLLREVTVVTTPPADAK